MSLNKKRKDRNHLKRSYKTTVGLINADTLAFTAGKDPDLDRH